MNGLRNESTPADGDDWDEFELQLRKRSLGGAPPRRDEILFQCGYAAGVAATNQQLIQGVQRWRVLGLVASLLACASMATQLFSIESASTQPEAANQSLAIVQPNSSEPIEPIETMPPVLPPASESWITRLTQQRQGDGRRNTILRANATELNDANLDGLLVPSNRDPSETILQPRDFPLFLQGEV